ncbi:DUF499 domain-containing protein [bacterium]|nr:DUF499 domain-containing protein [bacterium]
MKTIQENLFKALGLFIEAMRPYVVSVLMKQPGANWENWFYDSLSHAQRQSWDIGLEKGTPPENLIDFHNLKGFALKYRELLQADFKKKVNSLPTWLEEIAEARNKCQHFNELNDQEIQDGFSNMLKIVNHLKMKDVEKAITQLRDAEDEKPAVEPQAVAPGERSAGLIPWFRNVVPHLDIRTNQLDESVFAANLGDVARGSSREIYLNPTLFFSKTFFTKGLKNVAKRVIKGLNGGEDAENRVISLQTGFGGGKTHTLISLYHLAAWGKKAANSSSVKDLFQTIDQPTFEKANIGVFTNTTNDPTQGREVDGLHIQTVWGELAYQLGGKAAYELIRANDENRTAPKGLFKQVLEKTQPALILMDEIADYCVSAAGVAVGSSTLSDQTISFVQELSEAVTTTDRCILVASLPQSEAEMTNSQHTTQILTSLSARLGRVGADTKPVAEDEIYEVIRYRLFENLGSEEQKENVISAYMHLYQSLISEVPDHAQTMEYKEKLRKSYPFHPELIDMFRIRWASSHDFQRTRGVLRLLASIVADLWQRQGSLSGSQSLIHTSDVSFKNLDALCGQLIRLYGTGFDAVITADVSGGSSNSFFIDSDKADYGNYQLTQGIAATILLGSFGSGGVNRGISIEEIKLATVKPDSFNHNHINGALDALEGKAYYLYYSSTGSTSRRYWFYTKPNINILINQARSDVKKSDLHAEILNRIQKRASNIHTFNTLVNPGADVPEQKRLTLIIPGPEYLANPENVTRQTKKLLEQLATKKGTGERIYRNTMLFLICSEYGYSRLCDELKNYLACEKIKLDYRGQLEADQKEDLRKRSEDHHKQAAYYLAEAYSIVAKYSAKTGVKILVAKQFKDSLDLQVNANILQLLKDEEWLLESVGLGTLKRHNLFPEPNKPVKAKDVYEAFLRFDDKEFITEVATVQNSLLKYCNNGEVVIASGDGREFNKMYLKETVPFFDVTDESYWLLDKSNYKPEAPDVPAAHEPDKGEEPDAGGGDQGGGPAAKTVNEPPPIKTYKSITVSGNVDVANYSQLFTSFIVPLQNNGVEITVSIKGKSTQANPITESSQQYKIVKESAAQLNLNFETEEQ